MCAVRHAVLALLALPLALGCHLPHDPEGTHLRVRGGTMRVGITENEPWTRLEPEEKPRGLEVELVQKFARQLEAEIEWVRDSESNLIERLHRGELDLVIGGLTQSTPWSDRVGLTQPYVELPDKKHVMAVPQGENRWLLELDRFLQSRKAQIYDRLQEEASP